MRLQRLSLCLSHKATLKFVDKMGRTMTRVFLIGGGIFLHGNSPIRYGLWMLTCDYDITLIGKHAVFNYYVMT